MGDASVGIDPISDNITTITAVRAFACIDLTINISAGTSINLINNNITCQLGCYFAAVDPDAIGFGVAAVRALSFLGRQFINTSISCFIAYQHLNSTTCKINSTAVDLQTCCRGAIMFSSFYIYLVTKAIIIIFCLSAHSDISRRDGQIVLDLQSVSRCRTSITRNALIGAAVTTTGSIYCNIACGNTAQAFIYRYFRNGIAANSPLHHCRGITIIYAAVTSVSRNNDRIRSNITVRYLTCNTGVFAVCNTTRHSIIIAIGAGFSKAGAAAGNIFGFFAGVHLVDNDIDTAGIDDGHCHQGMGYFFA